MSAPTGWLNCDGSAVSRTTYANLFAVIGTNYGVGDGSTTFNLPSVVDNAPVGAGNLFTLGQQFGAVQHNHTSPAHYHQETTINDSNLGGGVNTVAAGAAGHSDTYSAAVTINNTASYQPSIGVNFIIKY